LTLVIGDTGILARLHYGGEEAARRTPQHYERLFARRRQAGRRSALKQGSARLGKLMNENQELLQEMGVSSPELERLVAAARWLGGATPWGPGGNMIALVEAGQVDRSARLFRQPARVNLVTSGCDYEGRSEGASIHLVADRVRAATGFPFRAVSDHG
jgi:mevalonate kinase